MFYNKQLKQETMKRTYSDDRKAALEQLRDEKFPKIKPEEEVWCLHCNSSFKAGRVLLYFESGDSWLECPNEDCDGCPIDWAKRPWWRGVRDDQE